MVNSSFALVCRSAVLTGKNIGVLMSKTRLQEIATGSGTYPAIRPTNGSNDLIPSNLASDETSC